MALYDFRFNQRVVFEGPAPVEVFDPVMSFGGAQQHTMYHGPGPERAIRETDMRRKVLEHAANCVVAWTKTRSTPDIDLGPLGVLKNVSHIHSVTFFKDLEIEYECWINGEPIG